MKTRMTYYWMERRPVDRLRDLMERLSRNRCIWPAETMQIALRAARKFSGNPHLTVKAVTDPMHGWKNGKYLHMPYAVDRPAFNSTVAEHLQWQIVIAQIHGVDVCLLEEKNERIRRNLFLQEKDVIETKRFINQLKKEIHDGKFDENLRANARVSRKHGGGREGRNDQRQ